jgi:hypothetical protein
MKNRVVALSSARPRKPYSTIQTALALSLVPYVSDADAPLSREHFLRLVLDRIVNDLSSPLKGE